MISYIFIKISSSIKEINIVKRWPRPLILTPISWFQYDLSPIQWVTSTYTQTEFRSTGTHHSKATNNKYH